MLISISTPELVIGDYTQTRGCYSCATPDDYSRSVLSGLARMLQIETLPEKFHTTIMYSKEKSPAVIPNSKNFSALVRGIKHFEGHDKKIYVVVELVSPDLMEEHARLLQGGCEHSFSPYDSHVTLSSDTEITPELEERISVLNKRLGKRILTLIFKDQVITDVK